MRECGVVVPQPTGATVHYYWHYWCFFWTFDSWPLTRLFDSLTLTDSFQNWFGWNCALTLTLPWPLLPFTDLTWLAGFNYWFDSIDDDSMTDLWIDDRQTDKQTDIFWQNFESLVVTSHVSFFCQVTCARFAMKHSDEVGLVCLARILWTSLSQDQRIFEKSSIAVTCMQQNCHIIHIRIQNHYHCRVIQSLSLFIIDHWSSLICHWVIESLIIIN